LGIYKYDVYRSPNIGLFVKSNNSIFDAITDNLNTSKKGNITPTETDDTNYEDPPNENPSYLVPDTPKQTTKPSSSGSDRPDPAHDTVYNPSIAKDTVRVTLPSGQTVNASADGGVTHMSDGSRPPVGSVVTSSSGQKFKVTPTGGVPIP
jgi:hypothetical protein